MERRRTLDSRLPHTLHQCTLRTLAPFPQSREPLMRTSSVSSNRLRPFSMMQLVPSMEGCCIKKTTQQLYSLFRCDCLACGCLTRRLCEQDSLFGAPRRIWKSLPVKQLFSTRASLPTATPGMKSPDMLLERATVTAIYLHIGVVYCNDIFKYSTNSMRSARPDGGISLSTGFLV